MPEKNTSKLSFNILGDVQKLDLKAGDTVIVKCQVPLSPNDRQNVHAQFQKLFPNNQIAVLMPGMSLEVVSKTD